MRISDWSSDVCSSDLYEDAVFGDPLDLFTEGIGRKGRRAVDQAVFCLDNSYGDHRDRNDEAEEVEKKDKHPTSLSSARRQIRRALVIRARSDTARQTDRKSTRVNSSSK